MKSMNKTRKIHFKLAGNHSNLQKKVLPLGAKVVLVGKILKKI